MRFNKIEKCNCDCHSNPNISHVISCCSICPICSLRVKSGYMDFHMLEEHPEESLQKKKNKLL